MKFLPIMATVVISANAILIAIVLATSTAKAAGVAVPPVSNTSHNGIVTPDVAVGLRWFKLFYPAKDGTMLVCNDSGDDRKNSSYSCDKPMVPMLSIIPAGRTYVGFRVAYVGQERVIEVYWK